MTDEILDPYAAGVFHHYTSREALGFSTRLTLSNGSDFHVQFENGAVKLDGEVARVFDSQLATNQAISSRVSKINREAALQLVREHQSAIRNSAVSGGMNSESMRMSTEAFAASNQASQGIGNPQELADLKNAMHEAGIVVTVADDGKPTLPNDGGFKPLILASHSEIDSEVYDSSITEVPGIKMANPFAGLTLPKV